MTKESLKNKTALITGASKGLGKSIALQLAREGVNLVLVARSEDKLKEVVQKTQEQGVRARYFICDVRDSERVKEVVQESYKEFGKIEILVNNAAIWYEGEITEHPDEKLQELFEVNVLGYLYFLKYTYPFMKKQGGGDIINVVSIAGVDFEPGWAPYIATKHAIRAFIESVRKEWAKDNIRVMGIYPPGMDTEIFKSAGFDYGRAPWMTNKDDIAKIVIFMLKQPPDIVINHLEIRKLGFN